MNAVLDTILTRRSCRAYQQQRISTDDLQAILQAASYAPTGMAMQSWRFSALYSPEAVQKANEALRQALLLLPVNETTSSYMLTLIEKAQAEGASMFYGAPTVIVVSNERANSNAMADSALAMGNMMLCAHSLGIASCWLNQLPGFTNTPPVRAWMTELGIPDSHNIYASLALGYAAEPLKEADARKDVIRVL